MVTPDIMSKLVRNIVLSKNLLESAEAPVQKPRKAKGGSRTLNSASNTNISG